MDDRPRSRLWRRNTLHLPVIEPLFLGCPPHRLATTMTKLSGIKTKHDEAFISGPVIDDTSVSHPYMTSWSYLATPHTSHDTVARSMQVWY